MCVCVCVCVWVPQSCLTLCDPTDCSTPGSFVLHCIVEFDQIHVHWVGDAVSPSHPLLLPSPLAFSLSKHQGLFQLELVIPAKAHLTSDSRMSGSRWVTIPSWLSGSLRPYLYSSFVYSCHFFLISPVSVRSLLFLSFIVPIFALNVPLVSLIFLKRISLVFPLLLFSSISFHWSLKKTFLSLLAILRKSAFKWVYLFFSPLPFISILYK